MKGKVKFFNTQKGFGFVSGEDEKEYFMHVSQLPEDTIPQENDEVEFTAEQTDRGLQAQNIQLI